MSSPTDSAASRALRFAYAAKLLSWLAVLIGLGLIALFVIQTGTFTSLAPDVPKTARSANPERITASHSTVNGIDRENQPYEVSALKGWQDEATPNLVHLETVSGSFSRAGGARYRLDAATGIYDTKAKALDLAGGVTIVQADRFVARMDKARVVVEEKRLTSGAPVDVTFATGSIRANGMEITDDGARILFLNGVKAEFNAPPAPKGDAPQ